MYSRCSTCSHVKPMPPCAWIARSHALDRGVRRLRLRRGRRNGASGSSCGDAPGRPPRERAGELDLGERARERVRHRLVRPDPPPELLAVGDVGDAQLERAGGDADRLEGEDRERARPQRRQHVGAAERAARLAAGDDAERPALVARRRGSRARRRRAPRSCRLRRPRRASRCRGRGRAGRGRASSSRRPRRPLPGRRRAGTAASVDVDQSGAWRSARPASSWSTASSRNVEPGAAVLLGDRRARPAELGERVPTSARRSPRGTRAPAREARPAAV